MLEGGVFGEQRQEVSFVVLLDSLENVLNELLRGVEELLGHLQCLCQGLVQKSCVEVPEECGVLEPFVWCEMGAYIVADAPKPKTTHSSTLSIDVATLHDTVFFRKLSPTWMRAFCNGDKFVEFISYKLRTQATN